MKIYINILLLFSICKACSYANVNKINTEEAQKGCYLIKSGEKFFLPDSNTPSDWRNTGIIATGQTCQFLLYNAYTSEINVFDYSSSKLIKQQKLPIEADGLYVASAEQIYFYSYDKGKLWEFNLLDSSFKSYQFPLKQMRFHPSRINLFNGVYKNDGNLFMTSYTLGEQENKQRFTCICYDVMNDEIRYTLEYPQEYQKANWGGGIYRWGYSCLNASQDKIIYSFPILHELVCYDFSDQQVETFYAGSRYIESIQAYSRNKIKEPSGQEQFNYFLNNNSYSAIIYDPYRKCYYRVAETSVISTPTLYFKQNSIIVLNEKLEKIGETQLPLQYGTTLLVCPDGLLIPYITQGQSVDDTLKYHVFKLLYK